MNVNKKEQAANRIPIRFADEETASQAASEGKQDSSDQAGGGELTPEEIGRQSSYEDETEMQRRIGRGTEQDTPRGRERADDKDTAGAPASKDLPENREDAESRTTKRQASASSINKIEDAGASVLSAEHAAAGPLLAELIATRAELKRLEAERAEFQDTLARRQADFENYRKRAERERSETYNKIVYNVVSDLLPVLDNMRRALDAESSVEAGESEEFRHFLHGVELISRQLNEVLKELGLRPVEALGQAFDPNIHEAVATESTNEYEPDTIMQEFVRGYLLGEKLLRPAIVKVAVK
jgi:molecular chaperone GrpE